MFRVVRLLVLALVLVALCFSGTSVAAADDDLPGRWNRAADSLFRTHGEPIITMRNGQVLLIGRCGRQVEVFRPRSNRWVAAASTPVRLCSPMLTRLPGGAILAFGGFNHDRRTARAAVYTPRSDRWRETGSLNTARDHAAVARLPGGRVLVAGGFGPRDLTPLDSAEIYHPRSGRWTRADELSRPRGYLDAAVLPNGDVLVAGGSTGTRELNVVEVFAVQGMHWSEVAKLPRRGTPVLHALSNGNVLAVGLTSPNDMTRAVARYRTKGAIWQRLTHLPGHHWHVPAVTSLKGRPLVVGGAGRDCRRSVYLFTRPDEWKQMESLPEPRCSTSVAALHDDTVISVGGLDFREGETGVPARTTFRFFRDR